MVEMARTEASLRSLLRNLSHLYVPFADAKDGRVVSITQTKIKSPEKSELLFLKTNPNFNTKAPPFEVRGCKVL